MRGLSAVLIRRVSRAGLIGAALALLSPVVSAEQKPLWEAGLGVGAISFPDYIGSSRRTNYLVPVPYFVYRGKILRADRRGLQAQLLDEDRVDSYLSLGASPPVRSDDDPIRQGMPNLDPTLEFGPAVEVHLWRSPAQRMQLDLRAPVRAVFSVTRQPRLVGWLFTPVINLDIDGPLGLAGWNLGLQTGPIFASRRYNETFYGVQPQYAEPWRPAYSAPGGYAGSQFTAALSRRFERVWVGAFVRVDDLHGAVFAASPLVQQRRNVSAGFGIAWILGQSSQMVDSHD